MTVARTTIRNVARL